MALIQMNYLSKTLGMHQSLNIILPEDDRYFDSSNETKKLKTMLLFYRCLEKEKIILLQGIQWEDMEQLNLH